MLGLNPVCVWTPHLIFLQVTLLHHFVPLLLECDNDEGDEDVDEEEREDYKVHDVEDGHLHAVASAGAVVFLGHVYWVLENPEAQILLLHFMPVVICSLHCKLLDFIAIKLLHLYSNMHSEDLIQTAVQSSNVQ